MIEVGDLSAELLGEYTHLRHRDSVLIRGWSRRGPDEFAIPARWPDTDGPGVYDPRLLTQTIRQSGLAVAHAEYGVPTSHQTLLHHLNFTVEPGFEALKASTFQVELAVSRTARHTAKAFSMDFRIVRNGATVSRADAEFAWISPAAYRRLRGEHPTAGWGEWPRPEPVTPLLVGRADEADVVLAPSDSPCRWQLRNDITNALLFDHPVDHVPGLVLLEAAYQGAHAALAPASFEPTRVATSFKRYVEFDAPCWIEAEVRPSPGPNLFAVDITGTQDGQTMFRASFSGVTR
ncbi:ScbA/BarX family gamma-butyrolactone biosynthesis protein [Streptomyces sp. 2A115]|uniref:ScbA/BarX family gamma-butyrolactone biosynthesis protein n=1 Tax=Streptomyces sp. 2A115 TaxID=3457439 RepID=UPI003FD4D25F